MKTAFNVLAMIEVLAFLYFIHSFVTDSLGPGWAFISVLTLVFIIAAICEMKGDRDVAK